MPELHLDDACYLRSTATRFRLLANTYDDPLAADMIQIARDLEQRADEIEQR